MKKKLLSIVLALVMVLSLLPAMALGEEPEGVAINATNFPDANFREFVKQYDTEEEGKGYRYYTLRIPHQTGNHHEGWKEERRNQNPLKKKC